VVLYGVTPDGGAHSAGSIFSLDVATRTFMPLYSFIGGADGVLPMAAIAVDSAGELYGVAFSGGDTTACPAFGRSIPAGCGTVYAFNPTTKAFKPLHTFDGADGARPYELIYAASQSAVYGVTLAGGNLEHCAITDFPLAGCGTVFKIGELP